MDIKTAEQKNEASRELAKAIERTAISLSRVSAILEEVLQLWLSAETQEQEDQVAGLFAYTEAAQSAETQEQEDQVAGLFAYTEAAQSAETQEQEDQETKVDLEKPIDSDFFLKPCPFCENKSFFDWSKCTGTMAGFDMEV